MTPVLTSNQRKHFLDHGFVVVKDAVPKENMLAWQELAWQRLGYQPGDPDSWEKERVHLPPSRAVRVEQFAPRAFAATCEVVGGAQRIASPYFWGDVFVCNLSEGCKEPWQPPSPSSRGWHKDGYFFRHFLDSPEQGLLTIVTWTDVLSHGGGTFIAPDSVGVIARHLAAHPEGVDPKDFGALVSQCEEFVEITAEAGDVVLLHPFMLHAVSQNVLRAPRFISNPILLLKEPMCFSRSDGDYSLVEEAVLRALGVSQLDFAPTSSRSGDIPKWVAATGNELAELAPDAVLPLEGRNDLGF